MPYSFMMSWRFAGSCAAFILLLTGCTLPRLGARADYTL